MLKIIGRFLTIIFCLLILNKSAFAIDCEKATTPDEKLICNNETLKSYDTAMSQIYNAILPTLNDPDKEKLIAQQKSWLKQRATQNDEEQLAEYYKQKIRTECNRYEKLCKSLVVDILNKWQKSDDKNQTLSNIDSIMVSSYLKGNLNQYIKDKKAFKEIEEDIRMDDQKPTLDDIALHKLENNNTLVTVSVFFAAYQGQDLSFLYNNGNFQVVRFPVFDGKLIYPFTHTNYADWVDKTLMIHNRSQGSLYECGTTQYYEFRDNAFILNKQTSTPCTDKELEAIENNKLTPENIKTVVDYPKQAASEDLTKVNDTSHFLTENKDMQFTFLFPVSEGQVQLKIIIPRSFKALQADPNADLLEFIPKTDSDPYKWSQIITLNKILGSGVSAPDYIKRMEERFLKSTENAKIIESDSHSYYGYQDAFSIIQYRSNERDEVAVFYSVSGPKDIANVQYALPLPSQAELKSTVQNLKDFLKSNVEIVKQSPS